MGRIDTQLDIIRLNRYGENVRGAIHDALDILEKTSGGDSNDPAVSSLVLNSAGRAFIGRAEEE